MKIKKYISILFTFCILPVVNCQINNTVIPQKLKIESIRKNFKRLNSVKKWDKIDSIEIEESTERGSSKYYYLKGDLQKIIVTYFGEMGKDLCEFYIKNQQISFVYERNYQYNRPIYYDSIMKKENNDTEEFDIEKSTIVEIRNYFYNGELIQQLGKKNKKLTNQMMVKEQKRLLSEFRKLKNKIN